MRRFPEIFGRIGESKFSPISQNTVNSFAFSQHSEEKRNIFRLINFKVNLSENIFCLLSRKIIFAVCLISNR